MFDVMHLPFVTVYPRKITLHKLRQNKNDMKCFQRARTNMNSSSGVTIIFHPDRHWEITTTNIPICTTTNIPINTTTNIPINTNINIAIKSPTNIPKNTTTNIPINTTTNIASTFFLSLC